MVTVIDSENLLVGRLASMVAKRALAGEEIAVINAEKAVISAWSRAKLKVTRPWSACRLAKPRVKSK